MAARSNPEALKEELQRQLTAVLETDSAQTTNPGTEVAMTRTSCKREGGKNPLFEQAVQRKKTAAKAQTLRGDQADVCNGSKYFDPGD